MSNEQEVPQVQFLSRDQVAHLHGKIRAEKERRTSEGIQKMADAYKAGKTPEEQEANIGKVIQEQIASHPNNSLFSTPSQTPFSDSKTGPATSQTQATPSAPFSDKPAES
jgi:hypothetical protein